MARRWVRAVVAVSVAALVLATIIGALGAIIGLESADTGVVEYGWSVFWLFFGSTWLAVLIAVIWVALLIDILRLVEWVVDGE